MEPIIRMGLVWVSPPLGVSPVQVVEPKIEGTLVWWSQGLGGSPSVEGALVSWYGWSHICVIPHVHDVRGACVAQAHPTCQPHFRASS